MLPRRCRDDTGPCPLPGAGCVWTGLVADQLPAVAIAPDRPLLICDADEVLFAYMKALERHLDRHGAYFNWSAFRLNGNIIDSATQEPLPLPELRALLQSFLERNVRTLEAVEHAADMLTRLREHLQVVVLTNMPHRCRGDRVQALEDNGMPFPVVSNEGSKGPAVAALATRTSGPVFFVDDSSQHHADVAELADDVIRIHFVADARLAALVDKAPASHFRAGDWPEIHGYIMNRLGAPCGLC